MPWLWVYGKNGAILGKREKLSKEELAIQLIRRIDINRELRNAGKPLTWEDTQSMRSLLAQWDRIH